MLGHRVVTLHPAVHGGILARRDVPEDVADLDDARDRADRPRRRQPLPVHRGRRAARRHRGGGGRDDRHRRPGAAARGREELRARRRRSRGRSGTRACSTSCARTGGSRSTRAARSPARRSSSPPRTSRRSRPGSPDRETLPGGPDPDASGASARSPTARTRTSGPRTTPRRARAGTCSRASSSCSGKELSYNNLNDLSAARGARRGVRAAGLRDRQAREPVRRRGRRRRSRRRTRGRSAPTRCRRTAASSSLNRPVSAELAERIAEQFVEVLFAPGLRGRRARDAASQGGAADPRLDRAAERGDAASATTGACSAACSPRTATPTSRTARG